MSADRRRTARQRRAKKALATIVIRSLARQIAAAASQRGHRRGRPRAVRSLGAGSLGALSIGAMSLGAGALGALAIGRLAIRRGTVGSLSVEDLKVGRLRVEQLEVARDTSASALAPPGSGA